MLRWRVALRYLFSKKSQSAVNIISAVAVAGVAVATAAIVIVLSVFNGFTQLAESRLAHIDPDLKVVPKLGKTLADGEALMTKLIQNDIVESASEVIEERGLLIFGNQQMPVMIKGVGENYQNTTLIDSVILDGQMQNLYFGKPAALLSVGVAMNSTARPGMVVNLYVPRRTGGINPGNPNTAFRQEEVAVTGVFQVDQPEYDSQHVFIPISAARELLEYSTEASGIEIKLKPDVNVSKAVAVLSEVIGPEAKVLTRAEIEQSAFRMIMVEKWITCLMLVFILVIAAFNIISTLALLVLEKKDNMATMKALGASQGLIRDIYMRLGFAISIAGGVLGIILGTALTLWQEYGHIIKLAGDPSQMSIHYYPVKLEILDLLVVLAITAIIALTASAIAAALCSPSTSKTTDTKTVSLSLNLNT